MDLFTLVKAQGADDAASPTIPFPSGGGTIIPTPITSGTPKTATISLSTTTLSMKQGDKATVQIVINTNGQEVKGFTLKVSFNPQMFRVTDADTKTTGIQISYTNTFYLQQVNTVDQTAGTIDLEAAATSGTSTVTNMTIAQFEVTALTNGAGTFQLLRTNSSLLDYNNTDILTAVNNVVINVSSTGVSTTVSPSIKPTTTIRPSVTGGITPRTALNDDIGNISAVVFGAVMIITGYYLFRKKHNHDLQR